MPGEELGPGEETGSGGGSFDDDAGTDGLASRWLSLFFLFSYLLLAFHHLQVRVEVKVVFASPTVQGLRATVVKNDMAWILGLLDDGAMSLLARA